MQKTVKETLIILAISVVTGFAANALSPKGIPIIGDYSERLKVDSASATTTSPEKKLTKEGFVKPVNIPAEAAKKFFDESVVFVDGREPGEFAQERIKGAINIPYKEFLTLTKEQKIERMKAIGFDKTIVSYCGGGDCEISIDNAYEFAKIGYTDVKIYLGGLLEWKEKGYPVEK